MHSCGLKSYSWHTSRPSLKQPASTHSGKHRLAAAWFQEDTDLLSLELRAPQRGEEGLQAPASLSQAVLFGLFSFVFVWQAQKETVLLSTGTITLTF